MKRANESNQTELPDAKRIKIETNTSSPVTTTIPSTTNVCTNVAPTVVQPSQNNIVTLMNALRSTIPSRTPVSIFQHLPIYSPMPAPATYRTKNPYFEEVTVITRRSNTNLFSDQCEIVDLRRRVHANKTYSPIRAEHVMAIGKIMGLTTTSATETWTKLKEREEDLLKLHFHNGELLYQEVFLVPNWTPSRVATSTPPTFMNTAKSTVNTGIMNIKELITLLPENVKNQLPVSIATDRNLLAVLVEEFYKPDTIHTVKREMEMMKQTYEQKLKQVEAQNQEFIKLAADAERSTQVYKIANNAMKQMIQQTKLLTTKYEPYILD